MRHYRATVEIDVHASSKSAALDEIYAGLDRAVENGQTDLVSFSLPRASEVRTCAKDDIPECSCNERS